MPLDYGHPSGEKLNLLLARLKATDPSRRIGSLLFNPGGPGLPGAAFVAQAAELFSPQLRARFDIVGFDPRGTGGSRGAINCASPQERNAYYSASRSVDSPASAERLFRLAVNYNRSCAKPYGSFLAHIGTPDAARDVDRIRAALGDQRLNWMGASYGTALGAKYAELFPDRVRTMALDAGMDHSVSMDKFVLERATATERGFERFAAWCDATDTCPLRANGTRAAFDALVARARANPLPTLQLPGSPAVTDSDIIRVTAVTLGGGERVWPTLANALAIAQRGDGSLFLAREDVAAVRAIFCLSWPPLASSGAEASRLAIRGAQVAPRFGATTVWEYSMACAGWPVKTIDPPHRLQVHQPNVLVIGATSDPITPYPWSERIASQIGSGVLLTRVGDGHWSYDKSSCVVTATDRYLIEGVSPAQGSRCRSDLDRPVTGTPGSVLEPGPRRAAPRLGNPLAVPLAAWPDF